MNKEAQQTAQRTMLLAFTLGLLLTGLKFWAWWVTDSTAILTDALESIVNIVAAGFALFSVYLLGMPRDENHPYGHGKIEFFAAGFEGGLISLAGLWIFVEGIRGFFYPKLVTDLPVGLAVTAVAAIGNGGLAWLLMHRGRELRLLTLEADGRHLLSDVYSSIGLLLGLGLVWLTGWMWLDSLLALILAGLILAQGLPLLRKAIAGLMDETDFQLLTAITAVLRAHHPPQWVDVHHLRVQKFGNRLHLDCHLTLPYYYDLQQARTEVKAMEALLNDALPEPLEASIRVDPCEPVCCPTCTVQNCPSRTAAFVRQLDWEPQLLFNNRKHQLGHVSTVLAE